MNRIPSFLFSGWGRKAAWAVLIIFVALEVLAQNLSLAPRLALFDSYERAFPRLVHASPVVIVEIDDASIRKVGQWPWPRQILASLLSKILAAHPAAVGFDMLFAEPDRTSPREWLKLAGAVPPALAGGIVNLPDHDAALAQTIGSGPVALGVGELFSGHLPDLGSLAPFRVHGAPDLSSIRFPRYNGALRSTPVIDNAAAGHGAISVHPDGDGVFRRLPLLVSVAGRLAPTLPLELIRLAAQVPFIDLYGSNRSIDGFVVGPVKIPTQGDGSLWIHYGPHDPVRFVSAADILADKVISDRFIERIVLVSASGTGLVDMRETPISQEMSGTEIQAQLLENILEGQFVERPGWAKPVEIVLTILFALVLIVVLPLLRPRYQLLSALVIVALLVGLGYLLFWQRLLLFDVATPAIGEAFVFVALTAGNFAEADLQRRRLRRELEERKLAEARAHGEREAGRRIQMGMLPPVSSIDDPRVDLDALMVPARDIGGDLYDFFKIDNDRLFFAIGDVSGKGLPAALFMALAKSQLRSAALSGETSVSAIMNRVNRELAHVNPEMLFITMFAGILHLDSGLVEFTNAGHDPPWLLRGNAPPHAIPSVGGPPLCTLEDFEYATEKCLIGRNDMLFLLTDGVTEAMTKDGELMGKTRVETALGALARDASAHMAIERVRIGVGRFVAGAEPSDDLTLLVLHLVATV